jgi:hypothetical protein
MGVPPGSQPQPSSTPGLLLHFLLSDITSPVTEHQQQSTLTILPNSLCHDLSSQQSDALLQNRCAVSPDSDSQRYPLITQVSVKEQHASLNICIARALQDHYVVAAGLDPSTGIPDARQMAAVEPISVLVALRSELLGFCDLLPPDEPGQ